MSDYLFHPGDLIATLEAAREKVGNEIQKLSEDYVLKINEAEYIKQKVESEAIQPLVIESGVEVVRHFEKERTRQGHFKAYIERIPAVEVSLRYSGDKALFKMRQNVFNEPTEGTLFGDEVRATFTIEHDTTSEATRRRIDRWEQCIRKHIEDQRPYLDGWNNQLEQLVTGYFKATKDRYLKKRDLVAAIGLPIRRRTDEGGTYSVGLPRKRISISNIAHPPVVPPGQFVPHPALDEKCYQDILSSIRWMGKTVERDPAAYSSLFEEHLRSHFLAVLNGSFEGQGSAETFSVQGKTDIFLRVNERAVFIAECKFWEGPAAFGPMIDQLTGDLTWRDSKTAILLFVRNVDMMSVMTQIPDLASRQRLFTKQEQSEHPGEFRFVLRNARDESLPLVLTIMCFHLPETSHKRGKK